MAKNAVEFGQSLVSRWGRPARLVTVAILALLLLIPLQMVESVVRERYHTYQQVVADIAGAWSSDQLVAGPALVVPYSEKVEVREAFVTPEGERRFATRWETRVRRAVLLPDTLELDAAIDEILADPFHAWLNRPTGDIKADIKSGKMSQLYKDMDKVGDG